MFDIGWTEMLIVGVIAILVVGPRELPGMLRTFGKTIGQLRRMAGDFQRQFDNALKEAELDEVRNSISKVNDLNPVNQVKNSLKDAVSGVESDISKATSGGYTSPASEQVAAAAKKADEAALKTAHGPSADSPAETARPNPPESVPAEDAPAEKAGTQV